MLLAIIALLWFALARVFGPSDLWDQTQPRTVSYTTDMLVNDRWILPVERGELPATKPPLYNWIAAPFVSVLGTTSEMAHKFPSVIALALCWLLFVRVGRSRFIQDDRARLGWIAALTFVTNYSIFKLGYLARPDMLLTLWLLLGWWVATKVLLRAGEAKPDHRGDMLDVVVFWGCFALAILTKGPAALALPLYVVPAARFVAGRWSAVNCFRWWWGLPISFVVAGAWVYGVWRIDSDHLTEKLWFDEIAGRVSGTGPEGARGGPRELITSAPNMIVYYLLRFAPWSLVSFIAIVILLTKSNDGVRRWRAAGSTGRILLGAMIFTLLVIAMYSFSAGKRADYIVAAFGTGALLAAWLIDRWITQSPRLAAAGVFVLSISTLASLTWDNEREAAAPVAGFGDAIVSFARETRSAISADPHPIVLCWTGETHLQALLGVSERDRGREAVLEAIDAGRPFWIIAGRNDTKTPDLDAWLERKKIDVEMTPIVQSEVLPRAHGWPERMTLFLAEP